MQKTFGPAATRTADGTVTLSCVTSQTYCFLLNGKTCRDQKPAREIEDTRTTPDWCKYAAGMRADLAKMDDFDRMGLTHLTRAQLMPLMKAVPVEYRATYRGKPMPLTEHNAGMMRAAIRQHRLAQEGAA
jgi:hypothetical protein